MAATTGDDDLKKKGDAMVAELGRCQGAMGNGYLSAFPTTFFDRLRGGQKVWAPFYTLHKILAGHLDMAVLGGNEQALETAEKLAGWVGGWTGTLSQDHMQRVLEVEHGGMNEALYNLCALTGKSRYLEIGDRFEHKRFFDPLAADRDELKGLHANTNIPKVIGAARRYELTHARRDREIAEYFWQEVTSKRSYCTGGTSNEEHWRTDPGQLSRELGKQTTECCCSYNMLKLTRHIFGWTADPRSIDYYERTLFNSRLGTLDPTTGMTMYYLPLASGYWKTFSSPLASFWCCTGTGTEEFSKIGDTIYFQDDHALFVNLFIASEVTWPEKGVRIRQETDFPEREETTLVAEVETPTDFTIHIRIPHWVMRGGSVKVNGVPLPVFASPGCYLSLTRTWRNGDRVEVRLPMGLHIHPMPDDPTLQAVMYGPVVLAGRLEEARPRRATKSGEDYSPAGEPVPAPTIETDSLESVSWLEPLPQQPLTFRTVSQSRTITLIPLYKICGERYAVYWKVRPKAA